MFKRRKTLGFWRKCADFFWPRMGFRRFFNYAWYRLIRLRHTPHSIALGFACGVFASFSPFIGLHLLIAIAIAWLLGGNILAATIGTGIGNPITFPFIWVLTFKTGTQILGFDAKITLLETLELGTLWVRPLDVLVPLIWPMMLGGGLLGILAGVMAYYPSIKLIYFYQKRKKTGDSQNE